MLSLDQIMVRLDDLSRLLTMRRTSLPHHRTMQLALDWSYQLCAPDERLLWARLSVFSGSFGLDAVEAVYGDVLGPLSGLADKSILLREDGDRFRLLETIRLYGQGKLAATGEQADARRRHRDHFLRVAERCAARWFGPNQPELFAEMRSEHDNLRAALDFCLSTQGETRHGLRLASALHFYWHGCGFMSEGRHWLEHLRARDADPPVMALWSNAQLAVDHGDFAAAGAMLDEAEFVARRTGDEVGLTYVMSIRHGIVVMTT